MSSRSLGIYKYKSYFQNQIIREVPLKNANKSNHILHYLLIDNFLEIIKNLLVHLFQLSKPFYGYNFQYSIQMKAITQILVCGLCDSTHYRENSILKYRKIKK